MAWQQYKMGRPEAEEALLALGGEDGQFVVRGHKDPTKRVLSVMFRGKPTHHLMSVTDEGVVVNNRPINNAKTIEEAIETLRTEKVKGWPVQLTDFPPVANKASNVASSGTTVRDDGSIEVKVIKDDGPVGLAYIGPKDQDDERIGIFVTKVKEGSPAGSAKGIEVGMRILSVNGTDLSTSPRSNCTTLFQQAAVGSVVEIVLARDDEAFALFSEVTASPPATEAQAPETQPEPETPPEPETQPEPELTDQPETAEAEANSANQEPQSEPEEEPEPQAEENPYDVVNTDSLPPVPARPSRDAGGADPQVETASIHAFADALGPAGYILGEPAWLHAGLDRKAAIDLLEAAGLTDGLFLVRRRSDPTTFAIDLAFMGQTSHHLAHADPADRSQLAVHGAASLGLFPTLNELIATLAQPSDMWPCMLTQFIPNATVDPLGSPVQLSSYSSGSVAAAYPNDGAGAGNAVAEAESRAAEGVVTDITQLSKAPMAPVDGTWKCGECGTMNHSDPRDSRQRRCGRCGVVRALRRARSDELPKNESPAEATAPKISAEAEADRAALQHAVRVLSAVRQDKLYEAVARYVNRKWSLTDLVLGLGEILKGVPKENRIEIQEKLGKLIPVSQREQYTTLVSRASAEEEIEDIIEATDLDELATVTRMVSGTLAQLRGDKRTDDQITSFERRVQMASAQRAWAVTKIQADSDEPFVVEKIAKAVHVGWARSVVSTWAPEYGIEPLGNLTLTEQGLMDSFNFSTAQGYNIYKQRVLLASQRYTLPDESVQRGVPVVPEASKHFYRVAAEVLLNTCQRLNSDAASKKVVRHDKFAFVELKQLGLLTKPPVSETSTPFSTPRRTSLTGRGNNTGFTPKFTLPPDSTSSYQPPAYDNGEAAPPWFHDCMDKETAISLLEPEDDGTFLVRQRPGKADFAIGFKFQGIVTHHLVAPGSDGVLLVNGSAVVNDAHNLEQLIAGLYQPQPSWPAKLKSFIPRAGVSSSTVVRTQSELAGIETTPRRASSPLLERDEDAVSVTGSVDWSRGRSNSVSVKGDLVVAVSIEKGDGPIGITFAGPRDATDPRVGVFITKVTEGTPAAVSGKIVPGLRVLSVNGVDTTKVSKGECAAHFKVNPGSMIDLVLKRDPEAFERFHLTDPDEAASAADDGDVYGEATPLGLPKAPPALPEGATRVALVKGDGPLGLTFVGPKKKSDPQRGIYITDIAEDTPAASVEGIAVGQRILAVNGIDTTDALKKQCSRLFKSVTEGEQVVLVVKDDGSAPPPIEVPVEVMPEDADVVQGGAADSAPIEYDETSEVPPKGEYEYAETSNIVKVKIVKGSGPLGLKFVGPKNEHDPREGIFVSNVKDGSPAAAATGGKIEAGLRVLSVNGNPTLMVTKSECAEHFNVEPGTTITIVLQNDEAAYKAFTETPKDATPPADTQVSEPVDETATSEESSEPAPVEEPPVSTPVESSVEEPKPEPESEPAPTSPSLQKDRITTAHIGRRVSVEGYDTLGTLLFVGNHHVSGTSRCGVALDDPVGKNDGSIKGHRYFECAPKCGILCSPKKVTLLEEGAAPPAPKQAADAPQQNVEAAPEKKKYYSITLQRPMSGGLGMSIAHRAGYGNFITVLKPGGVAQAAFAAAPEKHDASHGLKIMRLNGEDVADRPKSDATAILKSIGPGDSVTVDYDLVPAAVADIAPTSKSTATQPTPTPTAADTVAAPGQDEYEGMKRLQLIKLLRTRNVDYGDAKNTDELKELARKSHPGGAPPPAAPASTSAPTTAPTPANPSSSGGDEYDGMKRLQLIKLLRSRNVDYGDAKNIEELKDLARKSQKSGTPAASGPPKWITKMSREEATQTIAAAAVPGGFVLRPSERSSSGYTITTLQRGKPQNFGIDRGADQKFNFSKSQDKFDSIEQLVLAYTTTTRNYFAEPLVILPQFR